MENLLLTVKMMHKLKPVSTHESYWIQAPCRNISPGAVLSTERTLNADNMGFTKQQLETFILQNMRETQQLVIKLWEFLCSPSSPGHPVQLKY